MRGATVREWLAAEGPPQYGELFEQHRIGLDVLPDLTERDLQDLGIPLGDRKRILKAIQSRGESNPAVASAASSSGGGRDAERRQLTVMFCDMVGSTELSRKLDPEQLRELMRSYQQACGSVIEKYEGHVAQYLGDGLMVYFGWPIAHEDDAERALRAGLEVIDAVKSSSATHSLQVRIEIGHHYPPRILFVINPGGIKAPARVFNLRGCVCPAVPDQLIDALEKVNVRLGFNIKRRCAENW